MKNIILRSLDDLKDSAYGERYQTILYYFVPEFITALMLYSLPIWIDAYFVAQLKSTSTYASLGVSNSLINMIIKLSESFLVGSMVLAGQFNGTGNLKDVGATVKNAFWVSFVMGIVVSGVLYGGAYYIYAWWYNVPPEIIDHCISFLRLRAIGIFFMFIYFAMVGFLRGIKNTRVPMMIAIVGTFLFSITDWILVLGGFGIPSFGLHGSAMASVIQYGVMAVLALAYVLYDPSHRKFAISLFKFNGTAAFVHHLVVIIVPVAIDKVTFAMAYMWLCKMICPLGICMIASFETIKNLERLAFVPAIACAQIITFLVSNDCGAHNWHNIIVNIKRVLFLATGMVFTLLVILSWNALEVVQWFDPAGDFAGFTARVFPILSVLVLFDVLQLILSGALRGAGNVNTVMIVRLIVLLFFFVPITYMFSHMIIAHEALKFLLIYGTFYISNAIMSSIYIYRFYGQAWKTSIVEGEL